VALEPRQRPRDAVLRHHHPVYQMKVGHDSPPAQVLVEAGGQLSCPLHGRIAIDRCRACPFLQGALEDVDLEILCGFAHAAPIRRPD
jgi:hypothetical protein